MENPPIHIILHNPKMPQNTGNIGRMCSIVGARLHLIHPLGFIITDSRLKRAGMDYWYSLDVVHHRDWEAFKNSDKAPALERIWLFTTKAEKPHWSAQFKYGDGLMFGAEDCGVPDYVHNDILNNRVKIPHFVEGLRSLNLSTSAGIGAYEAMRQITLAGNEV
ncbi:MAG: tRNA (cytidine(34)-2'-O)-methyltransferase [Verrucomicrobiaceae bacterium]|jgi:tRNA (cytidine/uridine-2'-O-)-methyltransferase|nr:tRNA (cytidine(34)-2'-O)-methyltransferase [Verrucomicrobiaceae bacterium]